MFSGNVQQSVACNALHSLEARLCRWLLRAHDCVDGNAIPLTQDFLAQMLGVRRTTVNATASLCYAVVRHKIDKIFPPARFEIINEPVSGKRAAVPSG
jgi:hypothetical protein